MPRKTYRTDCPEISSVSLYIPKPVYFHGYLFPFFFLYSGWIYIWMTMIGVTDHFEAGMLGFAGIGTLQILTCLFCHWFVSVRCALTCKSMNDVSKASVAKVVPTANNGYSELVNLHHTTNVEDGRSMSWFIFQKGKFTFDSDEKNMFISTQFPVDLEIRAYVERKGYQNENELKIGEEKYGKNNMVMDIPKFIELFKERATAPFFVFQVFCVGLWCLDEYWYYSLFTLAMLVVFECTLVQQQLRHISEIRKMGAKPYLIQTYRNKKWTQVMSDQLIPGDLLAIARSKNDQVVPCDLLLVRGQAIVDEAMLTGESVPVMKEAVDSLQYDRPLNLENDGKLHVLFGGTKIVQHTPPPKVTGNAASATGAVKAPDNSCLAYVLRTGFSTSQGRLLKTILYSVKRVTANNLETFLFIMFLLIFAIAASAYVWINGTLDPRRNRYKLFLECTLILTSVVPPELPIELSLAVNSSLIALSKQLVFCTEPFRIPFAGKLDICCFDKTGTLTRDEMVVEGVAGLSEEDEDAVTPVSETPLKTKQVLASCHSLVQLDVDMVGDPLEKAILQAVDWTLTRGEAVISRSMKTHPLKIFQRFHFSSALRRMSVIAGHTPTGSTDTHYIASVKGSPEALKDMFVNRPSNYERVYLRMARRGARVLALGYRDLGALSHQQLRETKRADVEANLEFCGFVIISCPLKADSKSAVREISLASHHVTMITGDNPLTACHVARELRFTTLKHVLVLTPPNSLNGEWHWQSVDDSVVLPWLQKLSDLIKKFDLCLTGEGMVFLAQQDVKYLRRVVSTVKVFARVSPKQKEQVLTTLKDRGFVTLMCGDGTNDVGALKHADVGVALLANAPERAPIGQSQRQEQNNAPNSTERSGRAGETTNGPTSPVVPRGPGGRRGRRGHAPADTGPLTPVQQANRRLANVMAELEEEEMAPMVRLGDASIAAPFTCKVSSVYGVCQIIKQGRCTLVTTLQMFKILALNALILAYSQSVLFLDGVKFSDTQATLQGLLLAGCFLFISRSKPLRTLSQQRPLPNIFNVYTLLTVLCQFGVHFLALVHLVGEAKARGPPRKEGEFVNTEAKFEPNLLNSVVYLISMSMQITTFSINYKGHPFMESLLENRPLLYSLGLSAFSIVALTSGMIPDAAKQFEIVAIPEDFRFIILKTIGINFFVCLIIDRVLDFVAGKSRVRKLV